jgi:hypothetical protein
MLTKPTTVEAEVETEQSLLARSDATNHKLKLVAGQTWSSRCRI